MARIAKSIRGFDDNALYKFTFDIDIHTWLLSILWGSPKDLTRNHLAHSLTYQQISATQAVQPPHVPKPNRAKESPHGVFKHDRKDIIPNCSAFDVYWKSLSDQKSLFIASKYHPRGWCHRKISVMEFLLNRVCVVHVWWHCVAQVTRWDTQEAPAQPPRWLCSCQPVHVSTSLHRLTPSSTGLL